MKKRWYILIGLGPILVLACAVVMFEWSAPAGSSARPAVQSLVSAESEWAAELALDEARARYAWLATVMLNLVISVFAILCCGYIVCRSLARRERLVAVGATIALAASGIAILLWGNSHDSAVHRVVFEFTFVTLESSNRIAPPFLNRVLFLIGTVNIMAVVAPVCALVGFVAAVVPQHDGPDTIRDLRARLRHLRYALNVSAALLVSGILHMSAWLGWPAAFVAGKAGRAAIEQFTLSIAVFWGMTFTLMIVAAFVPAMMVLRQRACVLFDASADPEADSEKWLVEHGFKFSFGHQLPQVAVILAPLLAGPAASMFTALSSWGQ